MRLPFASSAVPPDDPALTAGMRQALQGYTGASHAPAQETVQRTRRVIRQQAVTTRSRRSRVRTLMLACLFFSGVMALLTLPLWDHLDELAHWIGIPDLQMHALFLAVWFLPATGASLLLWRSAGKDAQD